MTPLPTYLPDIAPLTRAELSRIVWDGPYGHVGPVHHYTPLQNALSEKTNCACYVVMTGLAGLARHLLQEYITEDFGARIKQFIYFYQLDWRYPIAWTTDADFLSKKEKLESIKYTIPFYFLTVFYRFKTPFCANPITQETSFMANFTLHLAGKERAEYIKPWIAEVIERLNVAAPCPDQTSLNYSDYLNEADFLQAALVNHGTPLSPRILDPSVPLDKIDHRKEVLAVVADTDFSWNAVLRAPADFERSYGIDGPYFSPDRDW